MQLLQQTIQNIQPVDNNMMEKARERIDILSKPPGS